MTEEPLLLMFC